MTNWDQIVEDTGWELQFITFPLTDGALDIATVADTIDALAVEGWELRLVGFHRESSETQLCFRRALPDRETRVQQVRSMQRQLQGRHN